LDRLKDFKYAASTTAQHTFPLNNIVNNNLSSVRPWFIRGISISTFFDVLH